MRKMKAVFYSVDGHIWYWGKYSLDDIATFKATGVQVMRDTKRNRRKLR